MRLNRRVPVGTHGGVRGRLSIRESLLLDFTKKKDEFYVKNSIPNQRE